MAEKTIQVSANASLTAEGTSPGKGQITWVPPLLPEEAIAWTKIEVSGIWTWDGRGNVSYVTINGTNTSGAIAFNVPLSLSIVSPLAITCTGNKNAKGNSFIWTDLIVTYTYSTPETNKLMLKLNGIWREVIPFKKENGIWTQVDPFELDQNAKYVMR